MFNKIQRLMLLSASYCFVSLLLFQISIHNVNGKEPEISKLADLDENNWRLMLEGEWMVEFYAPWCPACKSLAPIWFKYAKLAGNHKVKVGRVDVTQSPSLSGRFFVTALPTIYHVLNGKFRHYRGSRDIDSFVNYIKEKQWKTVEPLSAWKQPDSIHMSILSYFFKLSHYLKDINTRLHDDYGVPTWGSYALFAIATIFIGAVLGLILVCIVDYLYPPKKSYRQSFSEGREKDKEDGIEDIPADELEDEEPESAAADNEDKSTSEGEKVSGSDTEDDEANDEIEEDEGKDFKKVNQSEETKNEPKVENNEAVASSISIAEPENEEEKKLPSQEVKKRKPRKAD